MWNSITLSAGAIFRSQQIGLILSTSGVASILANLGLEVGKRGLSLAKVSKAKPIPLDTVFGKRLALLLVQLGPTFIKLGQMMATRPDFVGEAVAEELRILYDKVPPLPFSKIRRILKNELGKDRIKDAFRKIDATPLASASLSQTHRGELKDGTPVIIKVQKPGVATVVQRDLLLLEWWIRPLHFAYSGLGLLPAFEDFKQATLREIDYRQEAANIDRFRKNYFRLFSTSDIVFPGYFAELSTERVLVLEPMRGKSVSQLQKGTTKAKKAAEVSLAALLEQIFDHGFFHADPHAGNLFFIEEHGQIGFIDLGLVGQLDAVDKRKFLKLLMAVIQRDKNKLTRGLYELGTPSKSTDFAVFEKEIDALIEDMKKTGVAHIRIDKLVHRLFGVARKNGIYIPNRYVLMARACLVIEGVAKSLDPNLSMWQVAVPIMTRSLMKSYLPWRR
jgi:ubiquinone biosynthesis protein